MFAGNFYKVLTIRLLLLLKYLTSKMAQNCVFFQANWSPPLPSWRGKWKFKATWAKPWSWRNWWAKCNKEVTTQCPIINVVNYKLFITFILTEKNVVIQSSIFRWFFKFFWVPLFCKVRKMRKKGFKKLYCLGIYVTSFVSLEKSFVVLKKLGYQTLFI